MPMDLLDDLERHPDTFTDSELALHVGRLLLLGSPAELRRLHAAIVRTFDGLDPFRLGYRHGLADALGYFEVARNKVRRDTFGDRELTILETQVLQRLLSAALSANQLADALKQDPGLVTRCLRRLRRDGLVELWPGSRGDGRSRPHRATLAGRSTVQPAVNPDHHFSSGN